jgi:hypothetical protein
MGKGTKGILKIIPFLEFLPWGFSPFFGIQDFYIQDYFVREKFMAPTGCNLIS